MHAFYTIHEICQVFVFSKHQDGEEKIIFNG